MGVSCWVVTLFMNWVCDTVSWILTSIFRKMIFFVWHIHSLVFSLWKAYEKNVNFCGHFFFKYWSIRPRELVLNTYWVFNTLKKYWYWIFNTFWEEVLEKVLILSDWRSNTQYFFQEFFSHFNQKIQNFHAKLIFHSNKILEMKTLLQNQYFDSIYF